MQFMAIEVLQGKGHTYRHDLKSFFYVFIWMCIRYGHNGEPDGEESAAPSSKLNNDGSFLCRCSVGDLVMIHPCWQYSEKFELFVVSWRSLAFGFGITHLDSIDSRTDQIPDFTHSRTIVLTPV